MTVFSNADIPNLIQCSWRQTGVLYRNQLKKYKKVGILSFLGDKLRYSWSIGAGWRGCKQYGAQGFNALVNVQFS